MFFDELTPLMKELAKQPVAFLGGLFSGALRLNLGDDPLKSWLEKQGASVTSPPSDSRDGNSGNGPQSITIE